MEDPAASGPTRRTGRTRKLAARYWGPLLVSVALGLPVEAARVSVAVIDSLSGMPVASAEVRASSGSAPAITAYTQRLGTVRLQLAAGSWSLRVRHGAFATAERTFVVGRDTSITLLLSPVLYRMPERLATAVATPSDPGVTAVSPAELLRYPAPTADPVRVLRVLPGVASGGDQAPSAYSVRGGSFDENLVYVEGVEIEAPQLLRTGLAETMSPVNAALVERADFYAGVLPVRLGDRLSSALDVRYRRPDSLEVSGVVGLSRRQATASARMGRLRWILGLRRVDLERLTENLQTSGRFDPRHRDVQALIAWDGGAVRANLFATRMNSRFTLAPAARRLRTDCVDARAAVEFPPTHGCDEFRGAAEGQERFDYDVDVVGGRVVVPLGGLRLTASAHGQWREEREQTDQTFVADWLPRSTTYQSPVTDWLRHHEVTTARLRQDRYGAGVAVAPRRGSAWELGAGLRRTDVDGERGGVDSLRIEGALLQPLTVDLAVRHRPTDWFGHGRWTWQPGRWTGAVEARGIHFGGPDEWLALPRLRLSRASGPWRVAAAAGLAAQPPLFGELLPGAGMPRSQKGADATLEVVRQGARSRLRATAFHRRGWDRISFEVDDVEVRYSGVNDSETRVSGADLLLRGQVGRATGTLSYSWLWAREDLQDDGRRWLPLATDQRQTITAYLEDHMRLRMGWLQASRFHIRVLYGSGFPFTAKLPQLDSDGRLVGLVDGLRHGLRDDPYIRFDIGFTQALAIGGLQVEVREEVANLFDEFNAVGYRQLPAPNGSMALLPRGLGRRLYQLEVSALI